MCQTQSNRCDVNLFTGCAALKIHREQEHEACGESESMRRACTTTSEESTTLKSSPQIRFDCPLSNSFSRAACLVSNSGSPSTFSTYLQHVSRGFTTAHAAWHKSNRSRQISHVHTNCSYLNTFDKSELSSSRRPRVPRMPRAPQQYCCRSTGGMQ